MKTEAKPALKLFSMFQLAMGAMSRMRGAETSRDEIITNLDSTTMSRTPDLMVQKNVSAPASLEALEDRLVRENLQLSHDVREIKAERDKLRDAFSKIVADLTDLEEKYEAKENELAQREQELEDSKFDRNDLLSKIRNGNTLSLELEEALTSKEILASTNNQLEEQLENARQTIDELTRSSYTQETEYSRETQSLREALHQKITQNVELQRELSAAENTAEQQMQDQTMVHQREIQELTEAANNTLAELQQKCDAATSITTSQQAKIDELQRALTFFRNNSEGLSRENRALKTRIDQLMEPSGFETRQAEESPGPSQGVKRRSQGQGSKNSKQ